MKLDRKTIISYKGPIDLEILSFFGKMIKSIFPNGDNNVSSKIHKIFVELVQNIAYYSAEKQTGFKEETGAGSFEIADIGDAYRVISRNVVYKGDGYILLSNCAEINNKNIEELRMLKRIKRRELEKLDTGAHIGLIHIGLLAESKLDYKIEEMDDDYSIFHIAVNVKK